MFYSAYVAGALALLLMALSLNISRLRLVHKVSFGDGGIRELMYAVRAHGNTLEQSVIFILLLYFLEESTHIAPVAGFALGTAFVLARAVYCVALFKRVLLLRQMAHGVTILLQIAAAIIILTH